MELVFHLSGEHPTIPKAEALAFLAHRGAGPAVIADLDQVLVCRTERLEPSILGGLAMTHAVLEHLGTCRAEHESIRALAASVDPVKDTFSVRVRRIKQHSKGLSTLDLERSLGKEIKGNVDLRKPAVAIKGFLTSGRFVLGKELLRIRRSLFDGRRPHLRPFFHPSSLSPALSRSLCNICGAMPGKKVLDPFCGTGGLLIEAGLLGAEVFGMDIDERMVSGCRTNLEYFGLSGDVREGDAAEIGYRSFFDIVITDPPYGRSATTLGRGLETLYEEAVGSIYSALKKGGVACIISPHTVDLADMARREGFTIVGTHLLRVHRSLTRRIVIMEK